jgi:AcrR family transcriptional regulator
MAVSRQGRSLTESGRLNQKTRTRTALLQAAVELVREGTPPSIPAAAERALVSVATAYRYFSSAEDLWWEASTSTYEQTVEQSARQVEAAGTDPQARLEALIRSTGFLMLDDQLPYRRIAKNALDQWFRQQAAPDEERVPVRQGRRKDQIRQAIAPLADQLPDTAMDRLAHALGLLVGAEPMISLIDAIGLDVPEAKQTLLDAARWMLTGALAELNPTVG